MKLGIVPDLILFADTGGEKQVTYDYIRNVMNPYLRAHGYPEVTTVQRKQGRTRYTTLEGNCTTNLTMPSLVFGRKSCSIKWKREPQDKYVKAWARAQRAWRKGRRVVKVIGYDAGPKDCRRPHVPNDERYVYWYPLKEWGWDRARCELEILAAGLPLPAKSSCFFCPSMKEAEVSDLAVAEPEKARSIVRIELAAAPRQKGRRIQGLWRLKRMTTFLLERHPEIFDLDLREQVRETWDV